MVVFGIHFPGNQAEGFVNGAEGIVDVKGVYVNDGSLMVVGHTSTKGIVPEIDFEHKKV